MKFMKLGSKPDTFQADGKSARYVSSELATDITLNVGDVKFYLHKFPLLSKSQHLQKLVLKASEENTDEIDLVDFPGGAKAFEICAKFCYGMTVTLNAYNVVAARCAAEYLEMTEDMDKGNLVFKIEVFLTSSIFRTWKDSIIVLQTTRSLLPWSEDLKIIARCIDSIASKTSVDPNNITWSYTYNRKFSNSDGIVEVGMQNESVPKDWWVEDICELEIDLYKRVIATVKSKGRMDGVVIGEALKTYAVRWLPDSVDGLVSDGHSWRNKYLIETIIFLLPSDNKGVGCSCNFLLKLLKAAILVEASDSVREDLVDRISLKLHEASVRDLLIPARSPQSTLYDVELVQSIVNRFMMHEKETDGFALGERSLLNIGKLIDGYLAEIAHDPNLDLDRFIDLSRSVPNSSRPTHDGLYKAIDIYLKEHSSLTKAERKRICSLMDVKKLTADASVHAAQNDRLPLRVVVRVLFFEHIRAAALAQSVNSNDVSQSTTANTDEENDKKAKATTDDCKSLNSQLKVKEEGGKATKKNSKSGIQLLPSRSRRIFDKLWVVGKGNVESRSSETSGSSHSPTSMAPGDVKSFGSSSRNRRHSIS